MRIISGSLKGRQLKFHRNIRPTTNKVRKAIFDSLADFTKGASVLELFAGSGAIGIEAFSYGAKSVVFVDNDISCLRLIESNLKSLGTINYQIHKKDSLECIRTFSVINRREGGTFLQTAARSEDEGVADRRALRRGRATQPQEAKMSSLPMRDYGRGSIYLDRKFDIIFLDPPYNKGLAKKSLLTISAYDILAPQGILIIEHHKKEELPEYEGSLILFKQKRYGDTVVSFYRNKG